MDRTRQVTVAEATAGQRAGLALLAARAMRDNPLHVAALGPDPARRVEVVRRVFDVLLGQRAILTARVGGRVVGLAAYLSPPHTAPRPGELLRLVPALARAGTGAPRLVRWFAAWTRRDPATPHSHLGPVAVEERVRGTGVGSALLRRYVEMLDERGESGYLETDRSAAARLYRRFGFEVVGEHEVLRVRTWFMTRP